jgi:hypothetical protein
MEQLKQYSDPTRVLKLARQYYKKNPPPSDCISKKKNTTKTGTLIGILGRATRDDSHPPAALYVSTRKNKKYALFNGCKTTHFGQLPYEDYTKHKNKTRRHNYLTRSQNIKGDWKRDSYSANNLAIHLLW